jgi:hypothetical protein
MGNNINKIEGYKNDGQVKAPTMVVIIRAIKLFFKYE